MPQVQWSCGDVVGRIWFSNLRRFAPDDLECVSIVDALLRHHSRDPLDARQLRKRAGVARLWVGFRELRFRFGNRPYSAKRGIDVSEHHQSPDVVIPEDDHSDGNNDQGKPFPLC